MYVALEPFVRRRWPVILVGWSRLLAGNYQDPLVGRDFLIGCVFGVLTALLHYLRFPLNLFYTLQLKPHTGNLTGGLGAFSLFSGSYRIIDHVLSTTILLIYVGLALGFILFLVRFLLRRTWIAVAVLMVLFSIAFTGAESSIISSIPILLSIALDIFIYFRFGLLALITSYIYFVLLVLFPITTQLSAFYFPIGLTGLALLLAIVLYAFYTSLGGRPIFGTPRLDD